MGTSPRPGLPTLEDGRAAPGAGLTCGLASEALGIKAQSVHPCKSHGL